MPGKTYQERTAAQLDGLRAQLERLRDQVFERPGRFDGEERRQLEALRDQYHRARWYFDMLRSTDNWQELQPEMDRLLAGLQHGLENARGEQQARV